MSSRFSRLFMAVALGVILITSVVVLHPPMRVYFDPMSSHAFGEGGVQGSHDIATTAAVKGNVIMPKLANATAKAELGRATWKLLHTMTLRFPETPTQDERHALESYFHLLSRLYPCGECAAEFQELLKKYPPQTSSRKSASLWLCYVHNQVNERLKKPEFDCMTLDATYDCGCGDEKVNNGTAVSTPPRSVDGVTGVEIIKGG
ncbi:hypothetical protein FRB94_011316 [Tulasnella sp. JGI-2019a]|nr:hypothetical protein FRB93_009628 [Tulasnella sp. JGI-2019a]KAG8992762.1 hypothetical protein FRB94_011316 [Tulasnella sp. JGI-2019a]KAG9030723.1 hypothetical protein FRB95_003625 [Tulasnella sp. JGI-2019a]